MLRREESRMLLWTWELVFVDNGIMGGLEAENLMKIMKSQYFYHDISLWRVIRQARKMVFW